MQHARKRLGTLSADFVPTEVERGQGVIALQHARQRLGTLIADYRDTFGAEDGSSRVHVKQEPAAPDELFSAAYTAAAAVAPSVAPLIVEDRDRDRDRDRDISDVKDPRRAGKGRKGGNNLSD